MIKFSILLLLAFFCTFPAARGSAAGGGEQPPDRETIILHTDRDMYVSGEEVFFRIFLQTLPGKGEDGSRFAYLLLRGEQGEESGGMLLPLNGGGGWGSIYLPDTLSTGFYELVAFTAAMRNLGEACYFKKTLFVANRFDEQLEILTALEDEAAAADAGLSEFPDGSAGPDRLSGDASLQARLDRQTYGRRQKVRLDIEPDLPPGLSAGFSVAVIPAYARWFFLNGGGGPCGEGALAGRAEDQTPYFYRETAGPVLTGRVTDPESSSGLPGVRALLSTPDTLVNMAYTTTDEKGVFYFQLNPYHTDRQLYITLDPATHRGSSAIRILDPFELDSAPGGYAGGIPDGIPPRVRKSQDMVKVQKAFEIFHGSTVGPATGGEVFIPRLYSRPIRTVYPRNYVPLDNFQEITRELIPTLRIRTQRDEWAISMMNHQTTYSFFREAPHVFLNGLPLGNTRILMEFPSELIERIELLNLPWRYGDLRFNGILSVFTHDHIDPPSFLTSPYLETPPLNVLDQTTYFHPDYGSLPDEVKRVPDFRQLLFWEPDIRLEGQNGFSASFYTGDMGGQYLVVIRGVLDNGEEFETIRAFEVEL